MYWSNCLVLLVLCFSVYGKPSDVKDAFALTKQGITEYFQNGKIPEYLPNASSKTQLTHLFRPDVEKPFADASDEVCSICEIVVALIIEQRKLGTGRDQFVNEISTVCVLLGIENKEVCTGVVNLNIDIFMYIFDQNPEVTGQRVCSLILQSFNCDKGDNFEWTIDIPEGQTVEKPLPDDSETLDIIQISDFHYDPLYTPNKNANCDEPLCCQQDHGDPTSEDQACGYWSEYENADIPWHTVLELIRQVNTHKVDYIYYTGDVISHRVWSTSIENNTRDLSKVFQQFRESFTVPVYPILGNHEPHPLNAWSSENESDISISTQWLYTLVAEEWSSWVPAEAKATILRGGYYTASPRPGFRVVVLNSNVCYTFNWWLINNDFDPYGQLQWLVETLSKAEEDKESVHILSHIPTGQDSCLKVWSREYRKIVERFANTITAQFNGHTHKDEFSIFYSRSEPTQAISVAFNGASVTPYTESNPSYKVYHVDTKAFSVLDYDEWTFNLTSANLIPDNPVDWYKLYSFKDAYGLSSLDASEIDNLVQGMAKDHSIIDKYFQFKYRMADVAIDKGCSDECQKSNLCTMVTSEYGDDVQCEKIKLLYDENSSK